MSEMDFTHMVLKIVPAIAGIDAGCLICVKKFLAKLHKINAYDIEKVLQALKEEEKLTLTLTEVKEEILAMEYLEKARKKGAENDKKRPPTDKG